VWSPQTKDAFVSIKQVPIHAPVLALPDFTKDFVLETDACATGVGAVLMQQGHPLAFLSKALGVKNQTLSIYDKECLAILIAIEKWKTYLQHRPFTIFTDQKSLIHLGSNKINTTVQRKAFFKLMGFQYKIMYKKGVTNRAADALSRRPMPCENFAMSTLQPNWLETIVDRYQTHEKAKQLMELSVQGFNDSVFSLQDEVIRYKGRIWLGNNKEAHRAIMLALHSSAMGGHSGQQATYTRLKQLFYWSGMKQEIQRYIETCSTCQRAKSEHVKLLGKL
jgi:hypothetical protein